MTCSSLLHLEDECNRISDDTGRMVGLFHEMYHRHEVTNGPACSIVTIACVRGACLQCLLIYVSIVFSRFTTLNISILDYVVQFCSIHESIS